MQWKINYDCLFVGLTDFTTANFDVVRTFETESPYSNDENILLEITCKNDFHVAYLFETFDTESGYNYLTLTDKTNYVQILSKFMIMKWKFNRNYHLKESLVLQI